MRTFKLVCFFGFTTLLFLFLLMVAIIEHASPSKVAAAAVQQQPATAVPDTPTVRKIKAHRGVVKFTRSIIAKRIQDELLRIGVDAQASFDGDQDVDGASGATLLIHGKGISRPVAFNLAGNREFKKALKYARFKDAEFWDDGSYHQTYLVN